MRSPRSYVIRAFLLGYAVSILIAIRSQVEYPPTEPPVLTYLLTLIFSIVNGFCLAPLGYMVWLMLRRDADDE